MRTCFQPDSTVFHLRLLGRSAGFSLIELMVVLVIVVVLTTVAAPSFTTMMANQRIKSSASDLYASLTLARSEAIKRNTDVTLLPAASGYWQDGWSIPNPADSASKIDSHNVVPSTTVSGPASVVYSSNGRIRGSAATIFNISASGTTTVRCVTVDLSGRPSLKSTAC